MRLNQAAVCVVARTSQTSSVRPGRRSSATSRVAKFGRRRFHRCSERVQIPARGACRDRLARLLRRRRRAQSRASASENCVDRAAAASSTAFGSSNSSRVAQRNHGGAARLLEQPAGLAHQFAAFDLGHQAVRPSRAHAQPAAGEQIYSVRRGAGFEQQIARRQGEMHGAGRQASRAARSHARKIGCIPEAVDGPAHFLRRARLFFLQCHARFSGRAR